MFKTVEEVRCEDLTAPPPKKKWRLEDSIFAKKPKENDSKGFWWVAVAKVWKCNVDEGCG